MHQTLVVLRAAHPYEPIGSSDDDEVDGAVGVCVKEAPSSSQPDSAALESTAAAAAAAAHQPLGGASVERSLSRVRWLCTSQFAILGCLLLLSLLSLRRSGAGLGGTGSMSSKGFWDSPGATSRVLFVGDSFTFYNGGMDRAVKYLSLSGGRTIVCDSATKGGSPLEVLWGLPLVQQAIIYGKLNTLSEQFDPPSPTLKYDWVVLQDDLPEYKGSTAKFFKYARLFNTRVRSVGSKPLLYMAWAYKRLSWITLEEIAEAHRSISDELDIPVAPVGLAFNRSLEARPDLAMLGWDNEHETVAGTYLASNVILWTLFGDDPTTFEAPFVPSGVSADDGAFLRTIAMETVADWAAASKGEEEAGEAEGEEEGEGEEGETGSA